MWGWIGSDHIRTARCRVARRVSDRADAAAHRVDPHAPGLFEQPTPAKPVSLQRCKVSQLSSFSSRA